MKNTADTTDQVPLHSIAPGFLAVDYAEMERRVLAQGDQLPPLPGGHAAYYGQPFKLVRKYNQEPKPEGT